MGIKTIAGLFPMKANKALLVYFLSTKQIKITGELKSEHHRTKKENVFIQGRPVIETVQPTLVCRKCSI
jgi:hypothetical protein